MMFYIFTSSKQIGTMKYTGRVELIITGNKKKISRVETNYLLGIGEAEFSLGRLILNKPLGRVYGLLQTGVAMVYRVDSYESFQLFKFEL